MDVLLLGPVEARLDGRPIALGARKQRAVLAMLALESGRTVTVDHLAEGLWGEAQPQSATKMVQLYVHQLRRLVAGNGAEIITRGRGYELRLTEGDVDVARFVGLLERECPRQALALWRGEALADLAGEPFAGPQIRRLHELRLQAAEAAISDDLAAGGHREVLPELAALIDAEPLRERLHELRMLALYRSGRQAEALEAYRAARTLLVDRAGVEPGFELQRLHAAILHHDPSLQGPPVPGHVPLAPRPRRRGRRRFLAAAAMLAAIIVVAVLAARPHGLEAIAEDHVGRIDGDRIAMQLPVGHGGSAALTAGGSVWVANALDGTVSRVTDGRVVSITVGGEPAGLAFGYGSLWVADGDGHRVVQVDAKTNRVVLEHEAGNAPRAVAVAGGALWAGSGVDQAVRRIDLRTSAVRSIPIGSSPTAIAAGAGALWVASEEAGQVTRIDVRTGSPSPPIDVGNGPAAIAVGAGAVWVVNRHDSTLSRIDPVAGSVTWTGGVGRDPTAVAAGGGAVWVAEGEARAVTRVDPAGPRVTRTLAVGSSPAALAAGPDGVWAVGVAPQAAHRGGTLRVRIPAFTPIKADIDWLGPRGWNWETWSVASLAYDGLVSYRRVGGAAGTTLVGALAERVPDPSPDGRTYAFTLRRGLRYSDGTPVRVGDFRASLERAIERLHPPYFGGIVGARRCGRRCDLSSGIESDERARTITVHLVQPDSDFLHKLTTAFAFVVPRGFGREPAPGTGPYRVESWDRATGGVLVRNRFFEARPARPAGFADRIAVGFVDRAEIETHIAAVGRDTDVLVIADPFGSHITGSRMRALTATAAGRLFSARAGTADWMFLNARRAPFDDARVRRALNYAVDRARIVERVGGGPTAAPACQIVPAGLPGHRPYCPYTGDPWGTPDVPRARALVAASGRAGKRVTVVVPEFRRAVGRYFEDLLDDLGFRATLRVFTQADYFATVYDSGAQIGFMGWSLDYLSASSFIGPNFACASEADRDHNNVSRLCDAALARDVTAALEGRDIDPTLGWERADRRVVDLALAVPLTNRRAVVLTSERVGNVQSHPVWFTLLDQLWVT